MRNRRVIATLLVSALSAMMSGCSPPGGDQATETSSHPVAPPPAASASTARAPTLAQTARATINALADRDFDRLAQLVHPVAGVRFSPYAHVNPERDVVFQPEQIASAGENDESYRWGYYDGSGKPIDLTFEAYYDRFVYDARFAETEEVGYNTEIGSGNTINNIMDAYPDGVFVEYHVPGSDEYGGMDWRSLRLVFRRYEGEWRLVGIAHDQWTI